MTVGLRDADCGMSGGCKIKWCYQQRMLFEHECALLCNSPCIRVQVYITVHHSSTCMYIGRHGIHRPNSVACRISDSWLSTILLNHQALFSQDFRLCEMTLQLKVMITFFYFEEAGIMLSSSENSDVGIGASSWENKWCRSNSSEPIMLSVLLNTTSMSTVLTAPMFTPFMGVSMVTP